MSSNRKLLIYGLDAFALSRPIDDQVLMGMKALTREAGFQARTIHFSRYHFCLPMGWPVGPRSGWKTQWSALPAPHCVAASGTFGGFQPSKMFHFSKQVLAAGRAASVLSFSVLQRDPGTSDCALLGATC
ncbi:MAG: hypothetical protein NXI04_22170 [Planctomycetaceae bacterium]|nr:hypothetical protein [Planctomycetaceae bacterium]